MANSMALNTVYNQYLTTYAPRKSDTKYDTHKKSELKSITNSMARVNKDAPLYKLVNNNETREYIVGLKEESRMLQNTIVSVVGNEDSMQLDSKIAYSSNNNMVSAKYVGVEDEQIYSEGEESEDSVTSLAGEVPSYDIEVHSLASPQVNMGKFLPKNQLGIEPGDYTFDLSVNGQGYEFQYSIRPDDTNFDVQSKLSRLINNSGIHLSSTVEEDEEGNTSLRIESNQVGAPGEEGGRIFNITDANSDKKGSVEYLGIDNVVREATDAEFSVNGMEAVSSSNTFVLEKTFEITLNGVSPAEGVKATVGIKPNTEAAMENVNNLIGGINQFIKTVSEFKASQSRAGGLIGEINSIADVYKRGMSEAGITFNEEGTMDVDKEKLENALIAKDGDAFASIRGFTNAMMRKSKQVSLNPINYTDKTVVEYKNPGKTFLSPYVASAYAGMMFNSYC